MVRTPLTALAVAASLAGVAASAGAAITPRWTNSQCQLQQALFNVRHPHPSGQLLAGGNRVLRQNGCAQRVPGPAHWPNTQCSDYQVTFLKLHASPSNQQLATANAALKHHGCRQRVQRLPQAY